MESRRSNTDVGRVASAVTRGNSRRFPIDPIHNTTSEEEVFRGRLAKNIESSWILDLIFCPIANRLLTAQWGIEHLGQAIAHIVEVGQGGGV